jgi:hypothetical protein
MKKQPRKIIRWLIIGAIGILLAKCANSIIPPLNSSIIRSLNRHSSEYIQVLRMLSEDPKVGTIATDFAFTIDNSLSDADAAALGISESRLMEYRKIMKGIGVFRLGRSNPEEAYFGLWASGFAGKTHHKSLVWFQNPPPNEYATAFTHIRENWYIYEN